MPDLESLTNLASQHLHHLCHTIGSRSTGSAANRAASVYIASVFSAAGLDTHTPPFDCLDWSGGQARLSAAGQTFDLFAGPFSPTFSGQTLLHTAATREELFAGDPRGKILLIHGELAAEPLMPRHFPFYYPNEHEEIYAALEARPPLALLTATPPGGFMSGGLYPCPMIEDGSFPIPSAYTGADTGALLAACVGQRVSLHIDSNTTPSTGSNVIGRLPGTQPADPAGRAVICAHMDTKPTTPGALDNAAGVTTLLLLARLLGKQMLLLPIELVAFNGEDYYSAPGQVNYLANNGLDGIRLIINIDGVGHIHSRTAWSQYGLDETLGGWVQQAFAGCPGSLEGEAWYAGDHTMFVLNGIPALAITSQETEDCPLPLMQVVHTTRDLPDLVDPRQLVHLALTLQRLLSSL